MKITAIFLIPIIQHSLALSLISHQDLKVKLAPFTVPELLNDTLDWRQYSLTDSYFVYWRLTNPNTCSDWLNTGVIEIILQFLDSEDNGIGWMGLGFGATSMVYSDALVAHPLVQNSTKYTPSNAAPMLKNYSSPNSNDYFVYDATIIYGNPILMDSSFSGGKNNFEFGECNNAIDPTTGKNSLTCLTRRKLYTKDENDYIIKPG